MRFACLAFLIACQDPHDPVECGDRPALGPPTIKRDCERACAEQPANYTHSGNACNARHPDQALSHDCGTTNEVDGRTGCCLLIPLESDHERVLFFECRE